MSRVITVFLLLGLLSFVHADTRYASIRVRQSNIRYGPGKIYPIKFSYHLPNIPVEVLDSFEDWTYIRDIDGDTGWINSSFISKRNYAVTNTLTVGYKERFLGKPKPKFRIEPGVFLLVKRCNEDVCKVVVKKEKLLVSKHDLMWVNES